MKKIEIENRAKRFALEIIKLVDKLPKKSSSFVLGKQILRSATSIGANLVEGRGGVSKKDFVNFLGIARKSAIETSYWLELLDESDLVDSATISKFQNELIEITKIISSIILNTKSKF